MLMLARGGQKCGIASFEMSAQKTLYRMSRQALGVFKPTEREIMEFMRWLGNRIYIYDKVGTGNIDILLKVFNRARAQQGVTHFLIDSMMKCNINPEDYAGQKRFVDKCQNFAQEHNVHLNVVAHSRKGGSEDEKPDKMSIKGASEITDIADNVFTIWRDKKKQFQVQRYLDTRELPSGMSIEKLERKFDVTLECCKHREMGGDAEGQYGFYYDRDSMQFQETLREKPFIYFSGSK